MVTNSIHVPLVVDLDGTLVRENFLFLSAKQLALRNPFMAVLGMLAIFGGRANLKKALAKDFELNPSTLTFNSSVIMLIEERISQNCPVYLSTGSEKSIADSVAEYLGFFSKVFSTQKGLNNTGQSKARGLRLVFGAQGFDYVGNSMSDIPVWIEARNAYFAGTSRHVERKFSKLPNATQIVAADREKN